MKSTFVLACVGVLLVAGGCSTVTVREPLGEVAPFAERKALEGRWMNDDGDVAEVRMLKSGEMQFGGLEWDEEGQRYRAESVRFTVTTLRDLRIINGSGGENGTDEGYSFIRYEIEDESTLRLYLPTVSIFEQVVASGDLAGTIERDEGPYVNTVDVHIEATAEEVDAFLKKSGDSACFEPEPSVTFKRLKRFE